AGVVEKGEDPMDAAKRELMEETGIGGGNWQEWMTISANPSTHTNLTHCYLATDVEPLGEQHLDQGEDLEPRMFSREEVLDMLQKGEIWQALMAAPLWKYFANYTLFLSFGFTFVGYINSCDVCIACLLSGR
uniref:NUDIX hydrolase n=1 Tax=Segatella hominis TaxID=2518605 RepID=UPI0040388303